MGAHRPGDLLVHPHLGGYGNGFWGETWLSQSATARRASRMSHFAQCLLLKTEKPGVQDTQGLVHCSTASSNSIRFESRAPALLSHSLSGHLVSSDPSFILTHEHMLGSGPAAKGQIGRGVSHHHAAGSIQIIILKGDSDVAEGPLVHESPPSVLLPLIRQ